MKYIQEKKREFKDEIKYLEKALELDKNDTIAKFYLAYQYKEIGEKERAIELYNEVIEQNPDYSWAYYNLAAIYAEMGDENRAIEYLNKTIITNPSDIKAVKLLVKMYSKQKEYAIAQNILNQTLQRMPDEADLYYLHAEICKQLGDEEGYKQYILLTNEKKITYSGNEKLLQTEVEKFIQ